MSPTLWVPLLVVGILLVQVAIWVPVLWWMRMRSARLVTELRAEILASGELSSI